MSTCGEMPAARERRTRPVAQEAIASHGAIVGNGRRGAGKTACQTGEIKACGQVEVTLRWASSAFVRTDAERERGRLTPASSHPPFKSNVRPSPEEGTRHRLGA